MLKNDNKGINNERQLRKIGELVGFSFDLETKSEVFDDFIRSLWLKPYIDYEYSISVGASGGILSMWDNRFFSLEQKFSHRSFVGTIGSWVGISVKVGFINVYAPQDSVLKNNLWANIEREANSFNDFILRVGLVDITLNCRSFTRFNRDGIKESKLDRYLVSNSFFNSWKDVSVSVLCRSFLDHCPILLKVVLPEFGPKPFKGFDKWVGNADFLGVIERSWDLGFYKMSHDLILKNKIKKLRCDIKELTSTRSTAQNLAKEELSRNLIEEELKQKSQIKWAIEGDKNSKFKEDNASRPRFFSPLFRKLSNFDALFLESSISLNEVKEAVWSCASLKAPGPDESVASSLGCIHGVRPFIYLGLPVGKKMSLCGCWDEIVNRVRSRLFAWKAKSLLIGGRLTLLKSVLGSLPIYFLSLFKAPVKVINLIESFRCRFFWGFKDSQRGISWVKQKSMLLDPDKWGLEHDALWRLVIREFYGEDGGFCAPSNSTIFGGVWGDIIKASASIESIVPAYKNLFSIKISNGSNGLSGRTFYPRGRSLRDLDSLISLLGNMSLSPDGIDTWKWNFDSSGNSLPSLLSSRGQSVEESCGWWNLGLPNVFPPFPIRDIALGSFLIWVVNKILHGVFQCSLWAIWNWRKKLVNANLEDVTSIREEDIFPSTQRLSKTWIAARFSKGTADWDK
ncbi:RNA-directed DNA polymerase, eukaryota [Tanacetum coccineum]|uniref:RNA-directed DNA polymerase, eukaryota n=1 Tax=Tanacetum coccineum TaxID=301880 RepID=A0ABQ5I968_9ASTR